MADDDHPGFPKLDQKRVDAASRKVIKGIEASERTPERLDKSLARQLHRSMTLNTQIRNAVNKIISRFDAYPDGHPLADAAIDLKQALKSDGEATELPPELFEDMLTAAHEAYDIENERWSISQTVGTGARVDRRMTASEINLEAEGKVVPLDSEHPFAHSFSTRSEAAFFKRDKVLRAALEAALKVL